MAGGRASVAGDFLTGRRGCDSLTASRRRVLEALAGVAAGLVALVGLAGCGGDDEDDDDEGDD